MRRFYFALLLMLVICASAYGQASTPPENRNWKDMVDQMSAPTAPTPAISSTFSGSGLNDLTPGTAYTLRDTATFVITVAGTGTPNTYDWTETGGSGASGTGVNMSTSFATLADGFQVKWAATTGHTVGNSWTIVVRAKLRMYFDANGDMKALWSNNATTTMMMGTSGTWDLDAADQITWNADVGIGRKSAGFLKVTNASTGYGGIVANNFSLFSSAFGGKTIQFVMDAGSDDQAYTVPTAYPSADTGYFLTSTTGGTWSWALVSTDWANPGTIGSGTPNSGVFTTLRATSSGARFGSAAGDHIAIGNSDASGTRLRNSGDGTGTLLLINGSDSDYVGVSGASLSAINTVGAVCSIKSITENITLDTGAAFTDSSANLLPANSIILAVVARVNTTITTAANWKLGDATTADRFTAANSTLTAGTTDYGFRHQQGSVSTDAAGPIQTSAAKLRITLNAAPGAGVVRVTVYYLSLTAPTS